MKISKSILMAVAAAIVIAPATSCTKDELINPKKAQPSGKTINSCGDGNSVEITYDCPACGMG